MLEVTRAIMRVWRICKTRYAPYAFSGEGSRRYGGRWNSRGVPMIYTSSSLSLAAIELFIHLDPSQGPDDLVSVSAELPKDEEPLRWDASVLPPRWWSDEPAPMRALGDAWIRDKTSLAVMVPSVPIRPEWNVLLNPLHPRMTAIKIEPPEPFLFDARMFFAR